MGLGFKWAFIVLIVAYGLSALAAVENFNEMIVESQHDQQKLAADIQTQLNIQQEKSPEGSVSNETIVSQGFKIRLIRK